MITGILEFRKKTCVFKLNEKKFILEIEEIEERENLNLKNFEFLFQSEPKGEILQENLLVGRDFENDQLIHFAVRDINQTGSKTYRVILNSFVKFENNQTSYNSLQIQADELNWFHNIAQAHEQITWNEQGETQFKIVPFKDTVKEFEFNFNETLIKGNLSISTTISRPSTSPIKLNTGLNYYFDETEEIPFAEELVGLTNRLLQFITYRKNSHIISLKLSKKDLESGRISIIGELFINNFRSFEVENDEKIVRQRIVDYWLIEDCFPRLLEKISEKSIYLTHIPESSEVKRVITPERFIMATAGFEWQIRFSHKEKSVESEEKYRQPKKEILNYLDEKIKISTGDNKKYFKSFRKIVGKTDSSLSEKLLWALREFEDTLKVYIKHLYSGRGIESKEYKYQAIAERIQTQRNNIAHGNIDRELNKLVILDFSVLEWLYYVLVLDDIGVSQQNIQRCIDKLFNRNLAN